MENKGKQKTKETDVVKPYTIRILPNNESASQIRRRSIWDSKADKVIKFNEFVTHFHALENDIKEGRCQVPKILKINLDAHGWPGGCIFMGNETGTTCDYIYMLGSHIRKLLEMGVGKVYIKTHPCYGGCYVDVSGKKKSVFQIIKRAIQETTFKKKGGKTEFDEEGQPVLDKKQAEELINKVYCSTTRAGIGLWWSGRAHGHSHGYCQLKDVPWYKKLRYKLNDFLGTAYWTFVRWKPTRCVNWFSHMSEPKRKSMGVLIGSEGKIYFPLTDADELGYENYFNNPGDAKKLHKIYSGPREKKRAYEFLGLSYIGPKIDNAKAKNDLKNKKKHDHDSCWPFSS